MADNSNHGVERRPVLAFLTSNWISLIGSALVTIAGSTWLILLPARAAGQANNPYLGLLFSFAVPVIFFAGLVLIPLGSWIARKRIRAGLASAPDRRTALRHLAIFFAVMTLVNVVIGSQVTYRAVEEMESDQFCGQSCHVMKPQFLANGRSIHRSVACTDCHVVPGAAGFVAAKINGTKQLIEVVSNTYPRPVPPALQSSRLVSSTETCEQCHSRATNLGSPVRIISKFKDDEASTPARTVLVMNVGGGKFGGIHGAHMGPGVEIRYRSDTKRTTIPWVEYRNARTSETRTYTASGVKTSAISADPELVMQCADCHNRSGHDFEQPEQAVDRAINAGDIPVGLPFARKTGVELLKASYSNSDEAVRRIPAAFANFYRQNYPDIRAKRSNDVDAAGQAIAVLYADNVFSDLGVKWGTYPSNLGHADGLGCFRCHDENHATAQKKTITQDCGICHQVLAVDEASPEILKTLGVEDSLSKAIRH